MVTIAIQDQLKKAYAAFNARDIDTVFTTMHPDVQWPKAFEGGFANGKHEVKEYWTKQWKEINPNVEPTGFSLRDDETIEVAVHQVVKDLQDHLLFDGMVKHIYTLQNGLLAKMVIEE
jgi:hypothetical protein